MHYSTLASLHLICPNDIQCCWKRNSQICSYFQLFWECPMEQDFWNVVADYCEEFLCSWPLLTPNDSGFLYKDLLKQLHSAGKLCIACNWKSPKQPSKQQWVNIIWGPWLCTNLNSASAACRKSSCSRRDHNTVDSVYLLMWKTFKLQTWLNWNQVCFSTVANYVYDIYNFSVSRFR